MFKLKDKTVVKAEKKVGCEIRKIVAFQVQLLNPRPGWIEIDPEGLWNSVVRVVRNAIQGSFFSNFGAKNLTGLELAIFFCSTGLPLARTRWDRSTFSSHCPLSSYQRSAVD